MQNIRTTDAILSGGGAVAWKRLPLAALISVLAAAISNAGVYYAASGLGFIPQSVLISTPGGEEPLTLAPVVISSLVGAAGGAGVFAAIGLFSRRPVRTFSVVAAVVLVLSFAMPLTIGGAPVAMVLLLELMHVVAWVATVGPLTTLARREKGEA